MNQDITILATPNPVSTARRRRSVRLPSQDVLSMDQDFVSHTVGNGGLHAMKIWVIDVAEQKKAAFKMITKDFVGLPIAAESKKELDALK